MYPMPDDFRIRPADGYVFRLDIEGGRQFEGPMDLLLHLIEREELPITAVSLLQVTEQYLAYLDTLEELRPEGIAEFLVMAARLLYIKSVALLPQHEGEEEEEEEEDPAEALARQLREYKRFKEKAGFLRELEASGRRAYVRLAPPPQPEKRLDTEGLDLQALLQAMYDVLEEIEEAPRPVHSIAPFEITVEERMEVLEAQLREHKVVHFRRFLGQHRTRVEVVVSLMAVLELIKLGKVRVRQPRVFGEIVIESLGDEEAGTSP
ncbi:MAG: hypothetical protein D6775_06800 [Caldilineae bacterium]|nr:MAG: hypothetical protein D6775_06800 [Caldilineae bacterium]